MYIRLKRCRYICTHLGDEKRTYREPGFNRGRPVPSFGPSFGGAEGGREGSGVRPGLLTTYLACRQLRTNTMPYGWSGLAAVPQLLRMLPPCDWLCTTQPNHSCKGFWRRNRRVPAERPSLIGTCGRICVKGQAGWAEKEGGLRPCHRDGFPFGGAGSEIPPLDATDSHGVLTT